MNPEVVQYFPTRNLEMYIVVKLRSLQTARATCALAFDFAMAGASDAADGELTDEQRAVYDRQLRVWGVDAQRRLGHAKFFVAGLSGLCAEACKNVVLAGIGSVTLLEDGVLAQDAHPGNFLAHAGLADHQGDVGALTVAQAMGATLREMNPFGEVHVVGTRPVIGQGPSTDSSFAQITEHELTNMDVVLLCGASVLERERIGDISRAVGASIFAGTVRGYAGDFVADLGVSFEHVVETTVTSVTAGALPEKVKTTKVCGFVPLRAALASQWKDLAVGREGGMRRVSRLAAASLSAVDFEKKIGRFPSNETDKKILIASIAVTERENGLNEGWMNPETVAEYVGHPNEEAPAVAAVVGGVLAQEMLRAVTKVGEPCRNGFFFAMDGGQGSVENLGCPEV